ncbi:hypothetical protein AVEN_108827-1 [Araneus ventricosus]|uniref:Uncharacterized protein n=1 Tax=Araneus ventricosus TaxID=182803 RepID=A0A4Y2CEV7_ARAVE|nr:hypothetical protein AVEN_108827-1 [Araneus ventricosus]
MEVHYHFIFPDHKEKRYQFYKPTTVHKIRSQEVRMESDDKRMAERHKQQLQKTKGTQQSSLIKPCRQINVLKRPHSSGIRPQIEV